MGFFWPFCLPLDLLGPSTDEFLFEETGPLAIAREVDRICKTNGERTNKHGQPLSKQTDANLEKFQRCLKRFLRERPPNLIYAHNSKCILSFTSKFQG